MSYDYRNLVFEGGVVLGIAYGGVLQELQKLNILQNAKRVAGSSAGAITALLVSLGYSAEEFTEVIKSTDFKTFVSDSVFSKLDFFNTYGIHNGENLKSWVQQKINKKLGVNDLTFQEHHNLLATNSSLKELYIIGTNLSCKVEGIYSYETTPEFKISEAIRISMSVPFYFECVKQSCKNCKQTNAYKCDPGNIKAKCLLIDGGCLWNYPVSIFDYKKYLCDNNSGITVTYNNNPDYIYNQETLGFRLGAKDELLYKNSNRNIKTNIKNLGNYGFALIELWLDAANKVHLHKNDWARTIFIDTGSVNAFNFSLSDEEKNFLITNGCNGVEKYFEWRNTVKLEEYLVD